MPSDMDAFDIVDLIVAKRDGGILPPEQIRHLVAGYTNGAVPDYQMSAFLMAAFLRGMDESETLAMTDAMLHSGIRVDLSAVAGTKVGKHSTGGVGDKISLILGPIVAACGVPVPKVSGRGLGFTGGTLDKLESIPGYRTNLSIDAYRRQLANIGLVITGQTAEIAPADRALYALRDVTGTVEFIPFIASSIMSKKLAEGIDALVLDVKCGRGAFMRDEEHARELASMLVDIGERSGTRTVAWLTRMDEPLGRAVGNWPEVVEAIQCLQGAGAPDVMEVIYALAADMLRLGGRAETDESGLEAARAAVESGRAFEKFCELVRMQGGSEEVVRDPDRRTGFSPAADVQAETNGVVAGVDALAVGHTAVQMGAGRARKDDAVDPLAGIVLNKKPGDRVRRGDLLATLYTRQTDRLDEFEASVRDAFEIDRDAGSSTRDARHAIEGAPPGRADGPPTSNLMDRFAEGIWRSGA